MTTVDPRRDPQSLALGKIQAARDVLAHLRRMIEEAQEVLAEARGRELAGRPRTALLNGRAMLSTAMVDRAVEYVDQAEVYVRHRKAGRIAEGQTMRGRNAAQ